MDVFTVLGIFTLCFRSIICQSVRTTNCGTLEIVQPAVRGKDVIMRFTPAEQKPASDIVWYRDNNYSPDSTIDTDTTKYVTQRTGSIFLLRIKESNDNDRGDYYINIKDEHNRWICRSGLVNLQLQKLSPCGLLYLKSPSTSVAEGQSVRLGYIPGTIQPYSWIFQRAGNTYFNKLDIDGTTVKEQTLQFNDERVLTIQNIQPSQAGTYAVQCPRDDLVYTTGVVTIDVNVLPKDVHFTSPNKTFPGCEECLYQQYDKTLDVECSFTEGTEDASVHITVGSYNLTRHSESKGVYSGRRNIVPEYYHMKEVKCHVSTPSLQQPLTATSKLYILRVPGDPVLTMSTVKQDQPVSITCDSIGSRPPPRMFFLVGEKAVQGNQTDVQYKLHSTRKHNSTATLETVERRWNNKQLKCCLEHETLADYKCSDSKTVRYEYLTSHQVRPTAVHANHFDLPQKAQAPYTIAVVCTVLDANPACGARLEIINGRQANLRNISTEYHQTAYGGTTTITTYNLNVTEEDHGKLVTCVANCLEFNYKIKDSFTLTLPVVQALTTDPGSSSVLIWIIIGICVGLVCLVIVVVAIILHRRRDTTYVMPSRTADNENREYAELDNFEVQPEPTEPEDHVYDEADKGGIVQQEPDNPVPQVYDDAAIGGALQQEPTVPENTVYDEAGI